MADPVAVKCLSPLEWRLGWLKGLMVFGTIIVAMIGFQARSRGHEFSLELAIAVVGAFLTAFFLPSKVTLLEDGLAFKRYGFTKFIPYSKIRRTEAVQRLGSALKSSESVGTQWTVYCALRLHLEDGSTFDIGTGSEDVHLIGMRSLMIGQYGDYGAFHRSGFELKRALDARLGAAPEPATPVAEGLMRGEKSTAEWLETINAAAPRRGDAYRGGEGAQEALWRVLEDETAPREARAGAALALRTQLDDEGRNRMRVVVESCESPKLRVAIETALDVGTTETEGEARLLYALEQASLPREKS